MTRTGETAFCNVLLIYSIPVLTDAQTPEDVRVISARDTHSQCSYSRWRSQTRVLDLCAEGFLLPGGQAIHGSSSRSLLVALVSL